MTIITKIGEGAENGKKSSFVLSDKVPLKETGAQDDVANGLPMPVGYRPRKKPSLSLLLVSLLLGTAIIFTVVKLWSSYMTVDEDEVAQRISKQWCKIPMQVVPTFRAMFPEAEDFFMQEFDIANVYSDIQVPDFKHGRKGRFIHDFEFNKTAIVDYSKNRCFIMQLDREKILPPKSLQEVVENISRGDYRVDTAQVRRNMRALTSPMLDLSGLGSQIQSSCFDKDTFQLVPMAEVDIARIKRSLESKEKPFVEFGGVSTLHYYIVNEDNLLPSKQ